MPLWCNVLPEHQIALIASDRLVLLLLLLSRHQEFQRLCVSEGVTRRILNSRPVPRRHGGRPAAAGRWQGEPRLAGAPTHTHTKHIHTHPSTHTNMDWHPTRRYGPNQLGLWRNALSEVSNGPNHLGIAGRQRVGRQERPGMRALWRRCGGGGSVVTLLWRRRGSIRYGGFRGCGRRRRRHAHVKSDQNDPIYTLSLQSAPVKRKSTSSIAQPRSSTVFRTCLDCVSTVFRT